MLLPRFIKKLLAVLRGSVAPPLIFLSVLVGFWFGLMPGFYGLHVALIVIVLVLNVRTAVGAVGDPDYRHHGLQPLRPGRGAGSRSRHRRDSRLGDGLLGHQFPPDDDQGRRKV